MYKFLDLILVVIADTNIKDHNTGESTWLRPLINNNTNNKIQKECLQIESIATTTLKPAVVDEPMNVTFVRVSNWLSKVSNLESNLSS